MAPLPSTIQCAAGFRAGGLRVSGLTCRPPPLAGTFWALQARAPCPGSSGLRSTRLFLRREQCRSRLWEQASWGVS